MSEDGGIEQSNTFVWGTNLVIGDIQARIQKFMRCFVQEGSSDALYTTLIKQVSAPSVSCISPTMLQGSLQQHSQKSNF